MLAFGTIVFLVLTVVGVVTYATFAIDQTYITAETRLVQAGLGWAVADGRAADGALADELGERLSLGAARFAASGTLRPDEVSVPVPGTADLQLAWVPRHLGEETFNALAPVRLLVSSISLLALGIILHRLYILAGELERRRQEAHAQARRDGLTGLGNRLAFDETLAEAFKTGTRFGVIMVDLDDFKTVNDTHGHGTGDELLRIVATRLTAHAAEAKLVARIGGDEFAILHNRLEDRLELEELGRDLSVALSAPIQIGASTHIVRASIGTAVAPDDAETAEKLMRLADVGLYDSKRVGKSTTSQPAPITLLSSRAQAL